MRSTNSALLGITAVAGLSLAMVACGKSDTSKTQSRPERAAKASTKAEVKPPVKGKTAVNVTPKPGSDYIIAEVSHSKPKPKDPVVVNFESFKVTRASFDPQKLEGGSATIKINIASLRSGIAKRDGHLKSADYFDANKFGVATVTIKDVKKSGPDHYKAKASINLHGVEVTQPVEFQVVARTADSIRIKARHALDRDTFGIGKTVAKGSLVGDHVVVKLELTLKRTS